MAATKSIRTDYLDPQSDLRSFYQYPVQQPDFSQIVADKARENTDRATLQAVIAEQYKGLVLSEKSQAHLDRLADPNTFTITTGHQLVLFGGPLFTTYKVLTAIKLAEQLCERHPDNHFVPIFWIHTEDHDFEEVNHFFSSYEEKHGYPGDFQAKVGDHILTEAIEALRPGHLKATLQHHYRAGQSMTDAFRGFINELFGPYGVLMLDADHPRLKAQFRQVIQEEIADAAAFQAVTQTSQAMAEAGYPLQIAPREINLFYLDELGRNRIVAVNGHFEAVDRSFRWTREELQQMVWEQPQYFSPNVSLRPLYQEMILPNLCYIGGWGELAYWLQLKGVFEHFGVNFPLLLPRMSATILRPGEATAWHEKGFTFADLQTSLSQLHRKYMPQVWDDTDFCAQSAEILQQIERLHQQIASEISPTLARSGEALKTKTQRFLQNLEKKAQRVMRHRFPRPFAEIETLKQAIQPDGLVQERILSLASFPEYGPEKLIRLAWEHCQPLSLDHQYWVLSD